ncbi:MAG: GntR family transcriptional regulator [Clostridia bacterium]
MVSQREFNSESIYTSIKNSIINLDYPPNMQISENEIAKKFNVSRTPVKSVFIKLENEGYLQVRPQRGTYVACLSAQKISDFIYMRYVLEVDIVDEFIKQLEDNDIIVLQDIIKHQQNSIRDINFKRMDFFSSDVLFHGYMFEKLGRSGIWTEIQKMQVDYTRYRILDISNPDKFSSLIKEHIKLFQAILAKDIEAYKTVLKKHLQGNFENAINSELKQYFI